MIYVMGSEQAVDLGRKNWIRANIFAKNGNLKPDAWCMLAGSFIARDITIGERSVVIYDGAYSEPIPGASITLTATARKKWSVICYADLPGRVPVHLRLISIEMEVYVKQRQTMAFTQTIWDGG